MKRSKHNSWGAISMIVILLSMFIYSLVSKYDLKNNGQLVDSVLLLKQRSPYRGGTYNFDCSFTFDNKKRELTGWSSARSNIQKQARFFINHYFPGVFSKRFNKMELLMLPEDFAKYGLPYPDSLRWVDSLNSGR